MRMSSNWWLVVGAMLLVGCQDAVEPSGAAQGVSDTEIVLGSHTDLSGPVAIWGVGGTNGARLRFDAANAAGGVHGRQIRFVVEDTSYQCPRPFGRLTSCSTVTKFLPWC